MSSIAVRNDLRGRFGPARDQGARPTCLAFAISDAHAASIQPWAELSCEYAFYHAKKREGGSPTSGARIGSIREALEQEGQPVETDWSYLPALPGDLALWTPPASVGTLFRRTSTVVSGGFDEAWKQVNSDVPILIGMSISDAFYAPDADGVVQSSEPVDRSRRHAVVAVATGDAAGMRFLLVRNSWGIGWGLSGYAWITEAYLAPRILALVTLN